MPTRTLGCVPTRTYEEEELKHQNEKNVEFHTNGSQDKTEDLFKYLSSFCELLTSPYPNMQTRLSIVLNKQSKTLTMEIIIFFTFDLNLNYYQKKNRL